MSFKGKSLIFYYNHRKFFWTSRTWFQNKILLDKPFPKSAFHRPAPDNASRHNARVKPLMEREPAKSPAQ